MERLKILVVDDKRIIGDYFDFTLGFYGHDITYVQDPRDAANEAKKGQFDIAFLDILMPRKDGVDVLAEIKKMVPQLPVVMMTGYALEEKKTRAKELGAVTCLKKPFEVSDIRTVIQEAVGKDIE